MAVFRAFCRIFGHALFASFVCVVMISASAFGVTITYNCNNGINNNPVAQNVSVGSFMNLSNQNYPNGTCSTPTNSEFIGWYCVAPNSSNQYVSISIENGSVQVPAGTTQCNYAWGGGSASCGFELNVDTTCIALWRTINSCPQGTISNDFVLGELASGSSVDFDEDVSSSNGNILNFAGYGTIEFQSMCSSTKGIEAFVGEPQSGTGIDGCWCHVTSYTPTGQSTPISLSDMPWVCATDPNDFSTTANTCSEDCYARCAYMLTENETGRKAAFSTSWCTNTVSYDCNYLGSPSVSSTTVVQGQSYSLENALSVCGSRNGYSLNQSGTIGGGWICSDGSTPSSTLSAASGTWNETSDYTCVAQWDCDEGNDYYWNSSTNKCELKYNITYGCGSLNGTSVTGTVPTQTGGPYFVGTSNISLVTENMGTTYCASKPDNSHFTDWSCSGGGQTFNNVTIISSMPSADTTCTANWDCNNGYHWDSTQNACVQDTYAVTYKDGNCNSGVSSYTDNGASGSLYSVKNPNNDSDVAGFLPSVSDTCVRFLGWSTSPNGQVNYSCNSTGPCGSFSLTGNTDLYAICDTVKYDVIYHSGNCSNNNVLYSHDNVVYYGQSTSYSVLASSDSVLSDLSIPASFQGWATSPNSNGNPWCDLSWSALHSLLYGGNSNNSEISYNNFMQNGNCGNIDLYAVCCGVNLSWSFGNVVTGAQWPQDPNNPNTTLQNPATCNWGGDMTPLYTPVRTGYTFKGWEVQNYSSN